MVIHNNYSGNVNTVIFGPEVLSPITQNCWQVDRFDQTSIILPQDKDERILDNLLNRYPALRPVIESGLRSRNARRGIEGFSVNVYCSGTGPGLSNIQYAIAGADQNRLMADEGEMVALPPDKTYDIDKTIKKFISEIRARGVE